jgi:hypothetical protein
LIVVDEGSIVRASDQVANPYGYLPAELLGRPSNRLVPIGLGKRHGERGEGAVGRRASPPIRPAYPAAVALCSPDRIDETDPVGPHANHRRDGDPDPAPGMEGGSGPSKMEVPGSLPAIGEAIGIVVVPPRRPRRAAHCA